MSHQFRQPTIAAGSARRRPVRAAVYAGCILALLVSGAARAVDLGDLTLPPGFSIEILTDDVPNARQMALSPNGVLYVGSRRAGNLYAVRHWDNPALRSVRLIDSDLTMPSGLVWHDGHLFVGAREQILCYTDIDAALARTEGPLEPELITDALPDENHHGWKYLSVGPDGALYVPVGAPCNICLSDDDRFASILRMNPATGATTLYAEGVRNTVGLAWHPDSNKLWFSDNGRDRMGDDLPAEEINVVERAGSHFGYPFVHTTIGGAPLPDPKFGKRLPEGRTVDDFEAPAATIQAHAAALGLEFYTGDAFPAAYDRALFIAEHGSWNRSKKVGYQVSVLLATPAGLEYRPFVTGWLRANEANWGRPNDVLMTPAGDLLISDDQVGAIYRVRYTGTAAGAAAR